MAKSKVQKRKDPNTKSLMSGWLLWLGVPCLLVGLFILYGIIEGYSPESRYVLSSTQTHHFAFSYEEQRLSSDFVADLGAKYDDVYRFGSITLGADPERLSAMGLRIRYYLGVSVSDLQYREWMRQYGDMMLLDQENPLVAVDQTMYNIVNARIGQATPFLILSTADYLADLYEQRDPHRSAAMLLRVAPERKIAGIIEERSFMGDQAVNRAIAKSFMGYLVEHYGWSALIQWYRGTTIFTWVADEEFEKAFGMPMAVIEEDWRQMLAAGIGEGVAGGKDADASNVGIAMADVAEAEDYAALLRQQDYLLASVWEAAASDPITDERIYWQLGKGQVALRNLEIDQAQQLFKQVDQLLTRHQRIAALKSRAPLLIIILLLVAGLVLLYLYLMKRRQVRQMFQHRRATDTWPNVSGSGKAHKE